MIHWLSKKFWLSIPTILKPHTFSCKLIIDNAQCASQIVHRTAHIQNTKLICSRSCWECPNQNTNQTTKISFTFNFFSSDRRIHLKSDYCCFLQGANRKMSCTKFMMKLDKKKYGYIQNNTKDHVSLLGFSNRYFVGKYRNLIESSWYNICVVFDFISFREYASFNSFSSFEICSSTMNVVIEIIVIEIIDWWYHNWFFTPFEFSLLF